jgi:hypothetical protein
MKLTAATRPAKIGLAALAVAAAALLVPAGQAAAAHASCRNDYRGPLRLP